MKRKFAPALVVLALFAGPAPAGVDVKFDAEVPVGDDASLFFSISSRYYDRDQREVEDWSRRYYGDPDDLAVALFLNSHCHKGPEYFFSLRQQGLGWFEIANRCEVPIDAFFVPCDHEPGPPYGNAYGHWKKYKRDRGATFTLSDADVGNLVALRMAHEYYGVPVEVAMKWRSSGRDVRVVMNDEYHKRHGHGARHTSDGRRHGNAGLGLDQQFKGDDDRDHGNKDKQDKDHGNKDHGNKDKERAPEGGRD